MANQILDRDTEKNMNQKERALLVGVDLNHDEDFERSLEELGALAEAAGMEVAGRVTQALDSVNKAFYIGPGKVEETKNAAEMLHADIVLFDNSLSPSQLRNLQNELDMPVMDRSALILEIFADRATTREARLQVEVARLQYMLPRLVGLHEALSRQGGGSGSMSNKGAGEKKLELDRRRLEKRLTELRKELQVVIEERKTQRKRRSQSGIPRVALVGYTNAGKSTLLNAMLDAYAPAETEVVNKRVMEKDMLFATLDTTVRKIEPENHHPLLLSDTVGFIDKLPHNLVEAFQSTLEEAKEADVLLQVVDCSDPHYKEQIAVTNDTLKKLGAESIPQILIYNKADRSYDISELPIIREPGDGQMKIYMSAKNGVGLEELLTLIEKKLSGGFVSCEMLIPYTDGRALSYLNEHAVIQSTEYLPEGTKISVQCKSADYAYYEKYAIE